MSPTSSPLLRHFDASLKAPELSTTRTLVRRFLPIAAVLFVVFHSRFLFHELVTVSRGAELADAQDARSFLHASPPDVLHHAPPVTTPDYLSSQAADFPESRYFTGVAGFNYFENLYYHNGTFLFVTSRPDQLPPNPASYILSSRKLEGAPGVAIVPARSDRWDVITVEEAQQRLGPLVIRKKGLTFFFTDESTVENNSFLAHYVHFIGEMFMGGMMVASAAGHRELPTRIMYRAEPTEWRDNAGINAWFQQSILPGTAIEEATILSDRSNPSLSFVFNQITVMDRWAAHRDGKNVRAWNKATGDLVDLPVPRDWIRPLRDSVRRMTRAAGCTTERLHPRVPVVLYVNRQNTARRLNSNDADDLAFDLKRLANQALIELHDVQMEELSPIEQFCLATRADVMLGVHGDGLSHQIWMKPGSAVLEMMNEGGFARDYGLMADLLGHEYHTIHNDHTFVRADWEGVGQNEGFHSSEIRANSRFISLLVLEMAQLRTKSIEATIGAEGM